MLQGVAATPFVHDLSVDLAIRLAVAAAAGFFIGLERELTGSAAGMRTHSLVAMGACLFTVTGAYGFADVTRGASYDPSRIARSTLRSWTKGVAATPWSTGAA